MEHSPLSLIEPPSLWGGEVPDLCIKCYMLTDKGNIRPSHIKEEMLEERHCCVTFQVTHGSDSFRSPSLLFLANGHWLHINRWTLTTVLHLQAKSRLCFVLKATIFLRISWELNAEGKIEGNLESDRQLAKKLLKDGKKDRAKLLLRKKKYQESILTRTDGQLDNLGKHVYS